MPGLSGFTRITYVKAFMHQLFQAIVLTLLPVGISMAADPEIPAKVGVYAKHSGNKIVYHYRLTNKSPLNITAVSIGYDTKNDEDPGNDVWELSELPSGWNIKYGIPSASSNSPTYWRVNMTRPAEDSKTHAITWEIANEKSPVLSTEQTLAKMSIAVDKADAGYLSGHALVTFSDGAPSVVAKELPAVISKEPHAAVPKNAPAATTKLPPLNISVPIEPLDTSPPVLAVTLTPNAIWSTDNKHLPVNAIFTTKEDDYDSLPEIKLESITANEPFEPDDILDASYGIDDRYLRFRAKHNGVADRIYTVTYSATDASGNQTTASATLTVTATAPTPLAASAVPAASVAPAAPPAPIAPAASAIPATTTAATPRIQGEKRKAIAR